MRKIEKCSLVGKKQAIIHKYPWWMKWLIKYVDCYYIPDITDVKIKENSLEYPCFKYPKSLSKIYEIT